MKLKWIYSILFINAIIVHTFAEIIPSDRRIDWNPGIPGSIQDFPASVNVRDFGAKGDGLTDDVKAFKNAIDAAGEGTAVLIPEGDYRLLARIQISKSIVLRGEGTSKTRLLFDIPDGGNCLEIVRWQESGWTDITGGYQKGSTAITVEKTSLFKSGDYIEILQDNDPADYQPGYDGSFDQAAVGQVVEITSVSGNTLNLERPLYYTYNPDMKPRGRRQGMVSGAGLEDFTIERTSDASWGSTMVLNHCTDSWIRNVHSFKTITAHVFITEACRNEIRNCYFYDSHQHGSGGKGYGVRCEARASDNLIENNIFEHLRHSMVVQIGAAGNVFGYNYSIDPFYKTSSDALMADVVAHGHYSYMNLFEGNVVQFIAVDNVWGSSGPLTFFRNRIERNKNHYLKDASRYAFIEIGRTSPYQNVIGNELGKPDIQVSDPMNIHSDVKASTLLHGNYDYQDHSLQWDDSISDRLIPASLYYKSKPEWFGSTVWPPLGGDISPNTHLIPAQLEYEKMMNPGLPESPQELKAE